MSSIETPLEILQSIEPLMPLHQTALWVTLIAGTLIWLRSDLRRLLTAVITQIEKGAGFKAGPVELGTSAREIEANRDARAFEKKTTREKLKTVLREEGTSPEAIERALHAVQDATDELALHVEFPDGLTKSYPLEEVAVFQTLADSVYYDLGQLVEPYSYGTMWFLEDAATSTRYQHLREVRGVGPGEPLRDSRTLEQMGIRAGSKLRVALQGRMPTSKTRPTSPPAGEALDELRSAS